MIRLTRIITFPLKSAAGIDRRHAQVTPRGLAGDRRWMVVQPDGQFLTGRTAPKLVTIQAEQTDTGLRLWDHTSSRLVPRPEGPRMSVVVWEDTVEALLADDGGWLTERLGQPCRLVYMDEGLRRPVDPEYASTSDITSFADGFPVLLISEGSLQDLNSEEDGGRERCDAGGETRPAAPKSATDIGRQVR